MSRSKLTKHRYGGVISPITPGTNYYVAASGSDSNNGLSPFSPWQTVSKVNGFSFPSGQVIVNFKAGDTFTCPAATALKIDSSNFSNSGSVTFTSYGSGQATIIANNTGTNGGAVSIDRSHVIFQNLTVNGNGTSGTDYGILISASGGSVSDITINACNIGGFYRNVNDHNGSNIYVASSTSVSYLSVLNCTIGGSSASSPDEFGFSTQSGVTNSVLRGNVFRNCGGRAGGTSSGVGAGMGAIFNGASSCLMEFNVAHDLGGNSTTCGGPAGLWCYNADNITFQFNEVYNVQPLNPTSQAGGWGGSGCDWDGFDFDDGSTNILVQYNYSHDNWGPGFNLFMGNLHTTWGPVTVRYNISQNDCKGGTGILSGSINFTGNTVPATATAYIYNNTVYQSNPGVVGSVQVQPAGLCFGLAPTGGVVANNIFELTQDSFGNANFLGFTGTSPAVTINNNCYFAISGSFFVYHWANFSNTYSTIAAWRAASSQDANSIVTNPQLTSAGSGGNVNSTTGPQPNPSGYSLVHGSTAAVGTGIDLTQSPFNFSVGNRDYYGNRIPHGTGSGYNIGAYGAVP